MQQKLQTILFFTFLICVQISYINSLKIKSQFKSTLSLKATNATATPVVAPVAPAAAAPAAAPATPAPNATVAPKHVHAHKLNQQDIVANIKNIGNNSQNDNHDGQFHIHHVVPRNLTNTNNKLRFKLAKAREQLGQLNDVEKENLEASLFDQFPKKPAGVVSAAVIDLQKGKIDEQSFSFNLTSIKDLSEAISQGNIQATRTVTVDGMTYKLKKIGLNFFYGGIVGKGGIGAYLKDNYVVVITHNNFIGFNSFAYFFGQVIQGLEDNKNKEQGRYFKDNFDDKKSQITNRLQNDRYIYNQEQGTQ